MNIVAV